MAYCIYIYFAVFAKGSLTWLKSSPVIED